MKWVPSVLSVEMRKLLSYRGDFWLSFVGSVLAELLVAYYLWRAIFIQRGVDRIGGYTLASMTLYYLFAPLVNRLVRGSDHGFFSWEIYDGTLTRYLVYPVSFLGFKYVSNLASWILSALQLGLAVAVYVLIFGVPADIHLTAGGFALGLLACALGNVLYFGMASCIDLVAFWADNVWSLNVMLRMGAQLLGGALLPLTLFPASLQALLPWTPFPYFSYFPIRCFLGQVTTAEFGQAVIVVAFWSAVIGLVLRVLWQSGTRAYTGVGI